MSSQRAATPSRFHARSNRWLQEHLEPRLHGQPFLDSDDLTDLTKLREHVRQSRCLLLVQTKGVLSRPWCLLELVTAVGAGVPIVGVQVVSGVHTYDFDDATELLTHLDTALPSAAARDLRAMGVDLADAAHKLANTVPCMISVPLNMCESRARLAASLADIVQAIGRAVLPALPDKDTWLSARRDPLAELSEPSYGELSEPTELSRGRSSRSSVGSACPRPPARIPPEVPELSPSFQPRPALADTLREHALGLKQGRSTLSIAPLRSTAAHTTATSGM